jgi:hypothetical protein
MTILWSYLNKQPLTVLPGRDARSVPTANMAMPYVGCTESVELADWHLTGAR